MRYYKIYLDDTLVDDPIDWQELSITFTESSVFAGMVFSQAIPLRFIGSGYDFLLDTFEGGGCSSVDVRIEILNEGDYIQIFNGTIFLNNVLFDYHKKVADAEVKDNSFLAKIENNKDIKFKTDVGRSKNDEAITPCSPREIDFFTPSTGVYDVLNVECYDVGDVVKFLIQAMTDGQVTADCDFLDSSGLVFCTGAAILGAGTTGFAPQISFNECFEELYKKLNLSFIIEDPLSQTPVIKIEPLNDIFVDTENVTIENVLKITGEGDRDKYYQLVNLGSVTYIKDAGSFTFPSPTFIGTRNESYHLLGVCNSSDTLDLVGNFVVDSNVIEDIIVNASTDYNDNIFIVQTDRPTTDQATKYDDVVEYYYNKTLMNEAVAENFFGSIPNSIANYLGDGDDGFISQKNTNETLTVLTGGAFYDIEPVEYATEVSDPSGNYNNVSYYFTASLAGSYAFFASLNYYVTGLFRSLTGVSEELNIRIEVVRYADNTFATEIDSIVFTNNYSLDNITTAIQASGTLFLDINNTVRVRASAQKVLATDVTGASVLVEFTNSAATSAGAEPSFRCEATANGGGVYETYDEADVRKNIYTISEQPLTISNFLNIVNNIGKLITITGTKRVSGWVKELSFNPFKRKADLQIRSKL